MSGKDLIPPGLAYLADNITSKHNILGASRGEGAQWAKGLNLPKEAETIFFAGCGYQYTSDLEALMSFIRKIDKSIISTEMTMKMAALQKKIGIDATGIYRKVMGGNKGEDAVALVDAVKVLQKLGIEFGYLAEDEPCCGAMLYYMGLHKDFADNSQLTSEGFKTKGIKRIISIIPSCTNTMKQLLPQSGAEHGVEIKHFLEVVAEHLPSLDLKYPRNVKLVYHDPCQLARYMGIIDEPRQIMQAIKGVELLETKFTSGQNTTCCGGGGGFEAVFPEMSEILAVNRVRELVETGADIITTNCPGCMIQLKEGVRELKVKNVEVLDLAQIIARSMGV